MTDSGWFKPTSITLHPDTVVELDMLTEALNTSLQDAMREAIRRAGRPGMALTVPPRVLDKRQPAKVRKQKMLYMRAEECDLLWVVQRDLDLNASRALEVCIHNAYLACATK